VLARTRKRFGACKHAPYFLLSLFGVSLVSKIAYLFPGQGAQVVGMGRDLCAAQPRARDIFDQADRILGFSLSKLCFEGPEEALNATDVSQPAIFVTSVALAEVFRHEGRGRDLQPQGAAGLSLGEYTALWAAGALSFEDGVRLTRRRGELMQAAAVASPSTMVSLMGLDEAQVKNICQSASSLGTISPANYNCPGQIVVSGTKAACAEVLRLAEAAGGRAVELKVAGAFHCALMAPAAERLKAELEKVHLAPLAVPVVANVTAEYHAGAAEIRGLLVRQLTGAVLWQKSMERLLADGYDAFYEIGPGRVLRGLMRKIDRRIDVVTVNDAASAIA
jgi:[acyl-carrier-protein] S-malonyltransferase